jgi:uroporphyrinogen-III synthase
VTSTTRANFNGLRVLALESRRATELARLIETYGGQPVIAPALRELPLESNTEALDFAAALLLGEYDVVIFLTGVGTRELLQVAERICPREEFVAALARTKVAARGPKPAAVLRELEVPIWVTAPEPNTWRQLIAAMDAKQDERPLHGARVAIQEYGVRNDELIEALRMRGASVTSLPVYRWTLPEDTTPLENAITAIASGSIDVLLLTSGVQLTHLFQVAATMQREAELRDRLRAVIMASIGPTASEEIRRHDLAPAFEASHPKLGFLVKEAAAHAADAISRVRGRSAI